MSKTENYDILSIVIWEKSLFKLQIVIILIDFVWK